MSDFIVRKFGNVEDFRTQSYSAQYNGYSVFPGSKVLPGRDADPSPPSSVEVKNGAELYLYSP